MDVRSRMLGLLDEDQESEKRMDYRSLKYNVGRIKKEPRKALRDIKKMVGLRTRKIDQDLKKK